MLKGTDSNRYLKKCCFPHNILQIQKKKREGPGLLIRSWAETSLKLCRNSGTKYLDVLQGKANWLFVCVRNQKSWDFHRKKKVSLWDLAEMGYVSVVPVLQQCAVKFDKLRGSWKSKWVKNIFQKVIEFLGWPLHTLQSLLPIILHYFPNF